MRTILINERQIRLLGEGLNDSQDIDYDLRKSIAVWCLMNDFRFYNPKRLIGRGTSVANDDETQMEIVRLIMNAHTVSECNEKRMYFGYYDEDMNGMKIYKVETSNDTIYIEVADYISNYDADEICQKFDNDDIDNSKWYYDNLKWFVYNFC